MAQTKKPLALRLKPKETDEFISFSTKLLEFVQKNLTSILIVLAVAIIAAAVWGYLEKRQHDRQEKAAELYQAAISQKKTEIPTLLKELQTIVQDYPETGGALQARLMTANLLFQEKRFSEAANAFEALGQGSPSLAILVAENLSYCYEAQKDYQKAAAVLAPLVEKADLPYRQELLRRQALLFELASDTNNALAIYQKMLQDNPPESFLPYLQEKIKILTPQSK